MPLATAHCRHARTGEKLSGTWHELQNGNISVMNSDIPIVYIGEDHACEQVNRMMKINSGLIGISNNANAWQRFVLATPEMSRLSTEFKGQFGVTAHRPQEHHDTLMICLAVAASQRCPEARMASSVLTFWFWLLHTTTSSEETWQFRCSQVFWKLG